MIVTDVTIKKNYITLKSNFFGFTPSERTCNSVDRDCPDSCVNVKIFNSLFVKCEKGK